MYNNIHHTLFYEIARAFESPGWLASLLEWKCFGLFLFFCCCFFFFAGVSLVKAHFQGVIGQRT